MLKIISVVGARPNFMKIAPFIRAINNYNQENGHIIRHTLVHTGQHYDDRMSEKFFQELNIPPADVNLGIGSGTHAEQVGKTMIAFEKVLIDYQPDWVVVVGDVNATLACSVTAKKLNIKVCHIEAGLRSHDMTMPEEINRLVTDRLSDLLCTPDSMSSENLRKEGVHPEKIKMVGNIMIDTLNANLPHAKEIKIRSIIENNKLKECSNNINEDSFGVITLHRPSNVDDPNILGKIVDFFIHDVGSSYQIIWPIHPRTLKNLADFGLLDKLRNSPNIFLLHPVGYLEMLRLNYSARFILTDSGGLQEESCVLGTPCITMRFNTERPVTLNEFGGLSTLVGNKIEEMKRQIMKIGRSEKRPFIPPFWDGKTAERVLENILNY